MSSITSKIITHLQMSKKFNITQNIIVGCNNMKSKCVISLHDAEYLHKAN